jgi:type 1 glutamine amidotransferase
MRRRVFLAMLACVVPFVGPTGSFGAEPPHVVFLVSEDPSNYKAVQTIPAFADALRGRYGCRCTVLKREGDIDRGEFPAACFPRLEAIAKADLVVVFFRRCALPKAQIAAIRSYLAEGKPLVGIRTANHSMAVRGLIAAGHDRWDSFCTEVLGCGNHGYGSEKPGTDVQVVSEAVGHPILAGVKPSQWHSNGSLYLVKPIDKKATVLLTGSVGDKSEPVAWTRLYGKSRIFYTTLGHPDDFKLGQFTNLLVNALFWAIDRPLPQ